MKAQGEASLVRAIQEYLTLKGCLVWRVNAGMVKVGNHLVRLAPPGVSDVIGIAPDGRFIAVEAKRKPNKPTAFQLKFLHDVKERGGFACVVYEIEELFDAWKGYNREADR